MNNVAPTATGLTGSDLVAPGELYTVSLDGVTDASPVDYDAGLMISFDFNGDGAFDVTGPLTSASHTYDVSGTYNVVAWCYRRQSHLGANAVIYTIVVAWEVKQTLHHLRRPPCTRLPSAA